VLGTRSKRNIAEMSSGLPDNFIDVAPKKLRRFQFAHRADGSSVNPFAEPGSGSFTTFIPEGIFSPETKIRVQYALSNLPNARPGLFYSPSPKGKPKKAITPGGTRHRRHADLGSLQIFLPEIEDSKILDEHKAEICGIIANYQEREFRFVVTAQDIDDAGKQSRSSQAAVTGMPAKDAAKNSGLKFSKKQIWHWMHLIAFFMQGKASQRKENLVAGTRDANIRHLFAELEVPYLLQFFPDGIEVFGKVLVDTNNVGKTLEYNLATDDFTIKFTFDLHSLQRPNQIEGDCIHEVVKVLIERSQEKKLESFEARLVREEGMPIVSTGL